MEILNQLGYGRTEAGGLVARALKRDPEVTDAQELIKLIFSQKD